MSAAIVTPRLRLEPLNRDRAALQLDAPDRFFETLGAGPAPDWPPPLLDAASIAFTHERLTAAPLDAGWWQWIFIEAGADGAPDVAVGSGGFIGPPDGAGAVEIGYAVVRSAEGRGLASEAAAALAERAFADPRVTSIVAHTLDNDEFDAVASRRVVAKLGFYGPEPGPAPGVVRFTLFRRRSGRPDAPAS